jgi:hypothetical protein
MRRLLIIPLFLAALAFPTGASAAIGEAEALNSAIRFAAAENLTGTLTIQSVGAVTVARAESVISPGEMSPGGSATAYPFVLTNGSLFPANAPTEAGGRIGPFRYAAITISEANTEESLSPRPISIAPLGTVVTINVSATQATAAAKGSCQVDGLLVKALGRKHLHARLARAQHSLEVCEAHR